MSMLDDARKAVRVTTTAYDDELQRLIDAALRLLEKDGLDQSTLMDPAVLQAVYTYVRANFGSPADYDRLKAAWDEQRAELMTSTGFTDFGDDDDEEDDDDAET